MTYQSLIVAKCVNLITDDFLKELSFIIIIIKRDFISEYRLWTFKIWIIIGYEWLIIIYFKTVDLRNVNVT